MEQQRRFGRAELRDMRMHEIGRRRGTTVLTLRLGTVTLYLALDLEPCDD